MIGYGDASKQRHDMQCTWSLMQISTLGGPFNQGTAGSVLRAAFVYGNPVPGWTMMAWLRPRDAVVVPQYYLTAAAHRSCVLRCTTQYILGDRGHGPLAHLCSTVGVLLYPGFIWFENTNKRVTT
jgi:hypothetical protein